MKIAIIGTTCYRDKMIEHKRMLELHGHNEIRIPAFDSHIELDELGVCEYNRDLIEWADRVHLFWDQRSSGTIFDFGMVFALRKQLEIIYMERKTFFGVMTKYSKQKLNRLFKCPYNSNQSCEMNKPCRECLVWSEAISKSKGAVEVEC